MHNDNSRSSHHQPRDAENTIPTEFGLRDAGDQWLERIREVEFSRSLGRIGEFEVLEEAGRGAQGVVYKARRLGANDHVALKRLVAGSFATQSMKYRFDREIAAASTLSHPNIVRILAIDEVDGQRILAMEWVDGIPVTEWASPTGQGARSIDELIRMFRKVCDAVHHAHQRGVIHRDIKPSNILVDRQNEPHVVDFGLAKVLDSDMSTAPTLTHTDQFLGTPAYSSPEQLEGGNPFDVRTDIYSLGALLYHLVAGQLPYDMRGSFIEIAQVVRESEPLPPSKLSPRCNRALDAIVLKALAKNKENRYQSLEALRDDLDRYVRGEPVLAKRITRTERMRRLIRRNPVAASFMLAVFAGGAVGVVHLSRLSSRLMEQTALESARMHSDMLDQLNTLYSASVATPMRAAGVDVTHDFVNKHNAIPLPATFTIALGKRMRNCTFGMRLRLYSDHPFRTRTDGGPRDEFERRALTMLRESPERPVSAFEHYEGQYSLRYATARRMRASCVQCHNTHPDSTKTDWQVGDVRGVLEIIHPLQRDVERTQGALRGTFVLATLFSAVLFVISIVAILFGGRARSHNR